MEEEEEEGEEEKRGEDGDEQNPSCRYIQVCTHTFIFNPDTNPIIETVGKHTNEATNFQNTELLCFEFLGLVELLSDTVLFVNLHHFLGIYAIFLEIYAVLGKNLHPITQSRGRGPTSL